MTMNAQQFNGQLRLYRIVGAYAIRMAKREGHLRGRETSMLELRMGLHDPQGTPWSLDAIAEAEDVSAERVRQITDKGLRRMMNALDIQESDIV